METRVFFKKSEVFTRAHDVKKALNITMAEALKAAWKAVKIEMILEINKTN